MSFEAGDIVIPVRDIAFTDGSNHIAGKEYTVLSRETSYYNIFNLDYKLKESCIESPTLDWAKSVHKKMSNKPHRVNKWECIKVCPRCYQRKGQRHLITCIYHKERCYENCR